MSGKFSSFLYYFFWSCIIFIGSIFTIVLLSKFLPDTVQAFLRGDKVEKSQPVKIQEKDATPITFDETMGKESSFEITPESTSPTQSEYGTPMLPESRVPQTIFKKGEGPPLFTNSSLTPTGHFTNNKGTIFNAGTLFFSGNFPKDFEQPNTGVSANIEIELSFGWRYLPNFSELEKSKGMSNQIKVELPPLEILDLRIAIMNSPISNSTPQIRKQISNYIRELFQRQLISDRLIHLAQQRLASIYITYGYTSIELIPN